MPNCIQISAQDGYATLDQAVIHNNVTVEFHFRTTQSAKQNIFNLVQYLGVVPTAQFWIFVDENNTIGMSYHTKLSKTIVTLSCAFDTNIFDGNWHQASVRMIAQHQGASYVIFYLDGVPVLVNGQPQQQAIPTNFNFTGNIDIGYNPVIQELSHAPFAGEVAEVRVWGDSGAFLPRPFSPLAPATPGLDNYWPFWTNYDKGTNLNVCKADSATPATFSHCALGFVPAPFYDPWNEAILNAPSQPFPPFTDGQQGAAAQDIINQLIALHALEAKSNTVAALRALYTNAEKIVPSTIPDALSRVTPSQSDPDYTAAFKYVQQQLLDEVDTVQSVYQFQQEVTNFVTAYYVNLNSAFTSLLAADLAPVTFTTSVDISGGLAIAEALFEFVLAATPGRKASGVAGSFDDSAAAGISLICSLIDFLVAGDRTQYQPNTVLSRSLLQINAALVDEFDTRLGFVNTNGQAIIQNWGKLSVLQANSDDFNFGYHFSQSMGHSLYMTNLVSFSKAILTAQYAIWEVQAVGSPEIDALGYYGTDVLNVSLSEFSPNTFFVGTWNFFSVCNYDANPRVVSFTSAPSPTASDFLFNQCLLSKDDVLNWPFPRNCVNPFATGAVEAIEGKGPATS